MDTHRIFNQRGAASIAIAIVLLLIITSALIASQTIVGAVAQDAVVADLRVQSLFIAESGLERASQMYASTGLCSSADSSYLMRNQGSFSLSFKGATTFDNAACTACCRVSATGTALSGSSTTTNSVRTVEALLSQKSGTSYIDTKGNPHYVLSNTVVAAAAGVNQLFALSILWSTNTASPTQVTGVVYGPTNATPIQMKPNFSIMPSPGINTPNVQGKNITYSGAYIQIFYLLNPPIGTNNVDIAFQGPSSPVGIAFGKINVDGANPTTPITYFAPVSGTGTSASIQNVTVPANALYFDALARNGVGTAAGPACGALIKTPLYSGNGNNVAGETWYCGPTTTSTGPLQTQYTFTSNQPQGYAYGVVVINSLTTGGNGLRLRFNVGGATAWHEVITSPPP